MSNIYEIAETTGLSPSTVARALSGRGYCSKKSREIVLKAAQELNYVPIQAAKILKSRITSKIMFCIPDICNPYYFRMIKGVYQELEKHGYYTLLAYTDHNREKELNMIECLRERMTDGMIIVSFHFDEEMIRAIRRTNMPVVLTNLYESYETEDNFDCVYVDHTKASYIAAGYLVKKGHTKIVFVIGDTKEQTGKERLEGYRKALENEGISYSPDYVVETDYTKEGGYASFGEFLDRQLEFTGVVACNDLMGVGCVDACRERGLNIPNDISLVTLDNTDYCTCSYPKLTSVDMMQEQIGLNAAAMVVERIKNERVYKKEMVLQPQVVERDSVRELLR